MLFMGKMIIIGFGCCHGILAVKIKLNRTKFILFVILGTYTLSMDWVAFFSWVKMAQNSCHSLQSLGWANWGWVFDDFL